MIFNKVISFHNVVIYSLTQHNIQSGYSCDKACTNRIENLPWYNTTIYPRMYGSYFEYFILYHRKTGMCLCVRLVFVPRFVRIFLNNE